MKATAPLRIDTIGDYHRLVGAPAPAHPLISVLRFDSASRTAVCTPRTFCLGFYAIALKRLVTGRLRYGQQDCDFSRNALFAMAPGQVLSVAPGTAVQHAGWRLLVHPDLLQGTALAGTLRSHPFFGYTAGEAVELPGDDEEILNALVQSVAREAAAPGDGFTNGILVAQLELLLQYLNRFCQQPAGGKTDGRFILARFERALDACSTKRSLEEHGLPTVRLIAASMALSPDYLSGLLKELTGQGAQQHIQDRLVQLAKEQLSTTALSVSEIAYGLGFGHAQSFAKLFKSKTALTPLAYRRLLAGNAAE